MNIKYFIHILGIVSMFACCTPKTPIENQPSMTPQELEEAKIERNRAFLKQERAQIQTYIDSSEYKFDRTGSGMYYAILNDSGDSSKIVEGDRVEFEFDIQTIQGTKLQNSEDSGNKIFRLLKDEEIIGVHQGIALMNPMDEYLFIIPAHLAYGVTNENGAPINATLLYRIKIVSVN